MLLLQVGISKIVVFINKADKADEEMVELVQLEVAELLEVGKLAREVSEMVADISQTHGFSPDSPMVVGSAKLALDGCTSPLGVPAVERLVQVLDTYVELPSRSEAPTTAAQIYSVPQGH